MEAYFSLPAHLLDVVVEEVGAAGGVGEGTEVLAEVSVVAERGGDHVGHIEAAKVIGEVSATLAHHLRLM